MGSGRLVAIMACALALAAARAGAQAYKPTPLQQCDYLASLRIGPDGGSAASPLPHELLAKLPDALRACEQAALDQPKLARVHAMLARLRALAGDAKGALEAARKGAELGSANARVILGVMYAEGAQVPRDYAAARELFLLAAKAASPHAQYNLGAMSANGWGTEADETDAAAAFRRAALGRDALAMQVYGQLYDKPQAEQWLRKAAEAMYPEPPGNPLRLAQLGRAEPDKAALVAWYEQKAKSGEIWAQAYMGALYESGQWVRQDYAAAAAWYRRAGEAGNVPSQWRLAKFYREGWGVPRDATEERRWGQMWQVRQCEAHEASDPGANACDRLAADRYDPNKVMPGVDSFCMRYFAERAVAACRAAVKQSPATVRYRAQLARALAHTGNFAEARREAALAAKAGSTPAMVLMGVMSQRGLGTEASLADAQAWYRKAAERGDVRGASLAGMPVTYSAPSPAEQAARGDPRAQHNLAAQLEREKKYDEAIRWYTRAADQGFESSAMNLAQMYEKGIGVKADPAEAMKRYRPLAQHGNGEARYRLAKLSANAGQYAEAVQLYRRSIREDDFRAMLDLGELYEQGRGVRKDVREAVALYERAAERSPWARFKLGVLYLQGEGIPKDYAKARYWLQRSADDGNAGARNNLGVMYDRGLGVAVDYAAARDLYLAALEGGNPQAKGNLEGFYAEGRGAPSGPAALDWYRAGATAGIASAQYRLGRMYAKGENLPRNDGEALAWYARAAEQGHREARKEAGELYYAKGDKMRAAAFGHERAARELADELTRAGRPGDAQFLLREFREQAQRLAAIPAWPQGVSLDPGEDRQRTIQVRVAGVAVAQAAAIDAGMANVYDIIRWFPETDGKGKGK